MFKIVKNKQKFLPWQNFHFNGWRLTISKIINKIYIGEKWYVMEKKLKDNDLLWEIGKGVWKSCDFKQKVRESLNKKETLDLSPKMREWELGIWSQSVPLSLLLWGVHDCYVPKSKDYSMPGVKREKRKLVRYEVKEERQGEGILCRNLQSVVRTLPFTLSDLRSNWRVLNREVVEWSWMVAPQGYIWALISMTCDYYTI